MVILANRALVFKYDDRVNLLDIEELLNQGMVLLNHTAYVFGKYTNYIDDIEKMNEDQMRSSYGEWRKQNCTQQSVYESNNLIC